LLDDAIYIKKIAEKIEGKFRIYLRSQKRRFADGRLELIGLEFGPWFPFNVTTRLVLKRYGLFPFLVVQNAETRKIAFGLFNGPDLL
jgi:hypothetical protein